MDVQQEQLMQLAELDMETNGLEFTLDVEDIGNNLYDDLLSTILEYIGRYTDRPVRYAGDWRVTIRVKDIEFEGAQNDSSRVNISDAN
jgi:hypothetical protein